MDRKISWRLYASAFLISVFVFAIGLLVGLQVADSVNQGLQSELTSLRLRTTELELLFFLNTTTPELCSFYSTQVTSFDADTSDFGARLGFLEEQRGRTDAGVQDLKREFSLMQLRDFLFVKRVNELCPQAGINTVLFFYTNDNCLECTQQGLVGPDLKQINPSKVMVYAFDVDLNSPAVNALLSLYRINHYPSMVVNGETLRGLQTKSEITRFFN
ncbi:MAG: hypothetical protein ABH803_01825 [Candidatus Micrarchaeota archaeon]